MFEGLHYLHAKGFLHRQHRTPLLGAFTAWGLLGSTIVCGLGVARSVPHILGVVEIACGECCCMLDRDMKPANVLLDAQHDHLQLVRHAPPRAS